MKLIVVESPAKARTIEKFLGRGYQVAASYGHIRDLPSSAKEIPAKYRQEKWASLGVDTENEFQPIYVVAADSKKHVTALKKLVAKADELLLATDEDREGEAISWHLLQVLAPKIPVRRITFHEITKEAIEQALANPREVDQQLVRAQESRRILDRLYGYSLSPVLWKKVRTKLSAGRVQSVAVRLIVEREEERQAFHVAAYWDVEATLKGDELEFSAKLYRRGQQRLATGKDFAADTGLLKDPQKVLCLDEEIATNIARAAARQPWQVVGLDCKQTRQRPSPPFITSTLQQAASAKLGLSPKKTMLLAQRLYEGVDLGGGERAGLITYMRTDSLTLSRKALAEAEKVIANTFGGEFTDGPRFYKTKVKSAQEAHEAIRPTLLSRTPEAVAPHLEKDALALYRLIWNRTIASQMTDARLDKTTVDFQVEIDGLEHLFRANGSVVRFPGFLRVYGDVQKDTILPELHTGQTCHPHATLAPSPDPAGVLIMGAEPRRHETTPPPRYTEASLIKRLEEEGIGRPSTYAPIISTIQARSYVIKKGNALLPSYVGMAVVHLLRRHFQRYVDLQFTAKMEEDLDSIADGKIDHITFLSNFYRGKDNGGKGLLEHIDQELPDIEFPAIPLGVDPESGDPITVRIGRNYVYVQVGEKDKNRTATLPVDLLIDELTSEKALDLVAVRAKSREPIGQDPVTGKNVYALLGPYGPYVQLGEPEGKKKPKRISLPKGTRPEDIELDEALRFLALPRVLGDDPDTGASVTAGLGRFGPYVHRDGVYAKLDSLAQMFSIELSEALERIRNKNRKTVIRELGDHPQSGRPLQILQGRYGPYLTDGEVNAKLPRQENYDDLDLAAAVDLLAESQAKQATARKKPGGKAAKKRAAKGVKKARKKTSQRSAKKSPRKKAKKAVKKSSPRSTKKTQGKTGKRVA